MIQKRGHNNARPLIAMKIPIFEEFLSNLKIIAQLDIEKQIYGAFCFNYFPKFKQAE